jgi:transposase-like protein
MADEEFNLVDLLREPRFRDPLSAAEYLEGVRWPNGPTCPHCGEHDRAPYLLNTPSATRRVWKCKACRKQFTVMVGTIFESSHIGLDKWLLAFYLLCSSKKGMSAHQLHRMLGITYKSAWFLFHRIREAMTERPFQDRLSGTVEADETYLGGKRKGQKGRPGAKDKNKTPVLSLVERDGRVRSFRVANVTERELRGAITEHVEREARIVIDDLATYRSLGKDFRAHDVIRHTKGEYVRGTVYTNTVEGYFANLKRGVHGTYHRISRAHLPRYLAEFDFRYNARHISDGQRTLLALQGAEGKRLKYRETR